MLTVKQIQETVTSVPKRYSSEKLLDELLLLYKIEKGLKDVVQRKEKDRELFKKEMRRFQFHL